MKGKFSGCKGLYVCEISHQKKQLEWVEKLILLEWIHWVHSHVIHVLSPMRSFNPCGASNFLMHE